MGRVKIEPKAGLRALLPRELGGCLTRQLESRVGPPAFLVGVGIAMPASQTQAGPWSLRDAGGVAALSGTSGGRDPALLAGEMLCRPTGAVSVTIGPSVGGRGHPMEPPNPETRALLVGSGIVASADQSRDTAFSRCGARSRCRPALAGCGIMCAPGGGGEGIHTPASWSWDYRPSRPGTGSFCASWLKPGGSLNRPAGGVATQVR